MRNIRHSPKGKREDTGEPKDGRALKTLLANGLRSVQPRRKKEKEMTTTQKQLAELNNLYAETQTRQATKEEQERMQALYNEIEQVASIGMWASPKDRQYFYIEMR